MSDMHTDTMENKGELKISVRLKGKLAEHVKKLTEQEGFYDNKGEYIRDLVRRDIGAKPSLVRPLECYLAATLSWTCG